MSIHTRSNQYGKILGDWHIRKKIGDGSGETVVYQISRKDADWEEICALKAVPMISEWGKYSDLSDYRKQEYQKALAERTAYVKKEVQLMSKLRGRTNIVDYIDCQTADWEDEDGFGCDFLIRMELLQNLRSEIRNGRLFSEHEIIKIGMDICNALIVCHSKSIMHRDIKPENIFVNDDGDYKLGDFGISRIIDACPGASATTGIGTPEYAAPEQDKGKYDVRVDLYSLGLVLYELANNNHLPFINSSYVSTEEMKEAVRKRLNGVALPSPSMASRDLAAVILKACAFKPNNRYSSAQSMLDALQQISESQPDQRKNKFLFWRGASTSQSTSTSKPQQGGASNAYHTIPADNDVQPKPKQSYQTLPANNAEAVPQPESIPTSYETIPAATVPATPIIEGNTSDEWFDQIFVGADSEKNLGTQISAEEAAAQLKKAEDYAENGNSKLAHKYFKLAAENGNPRAMYCMGHCYFYGQEEKRNYSKAVDYFVKGANLDDVNAQYMLGVCYSRGKGVKKSYNKAAFWYQKACDNSSTHAGSALAHTALGNLYYHGRGVKKDLLKALDHYLQAMKEDDIEGAIRYERILAKASSDKLAFLKRNGHTRSNIPDEFPKRKKKYYNDKVDTTFVVVTLALPIIALISGIIMWFLSAPLWINILVVAIFGLLAVTAMIVSDRADHNFDDWKTKIFLYCIGAIGFPTITAIVIALLEGILWVEKWIFSFFS